MPLTSADKITALALTSGILKRKGLDFQSKQILQIACDMVLSHEPYRQADLMRLLNVSHTRGME